MRLAGPCGYLRRVPFWFCRLWKTLRPIIEYEWCASSVFLGGSPWPLEASHRPEAVRKRRSVNFDSSSCLPHGEVAFIQEALHRALQFYFVSLRNSFEYAALVGPLEKWLFWGSGLNSIRRKDRFSNSDLFCDSKKLGLRCLEWYVSGTTELTLVSLLLLMFCKSSVFSRCDCATTFLLLWGLISCAWRCCFETETIISETL